MIKKEELVLLIIFYRPTSDQIKNAVNLADEFNVVIVDNTPNDSSTSIVIPQNIIYCPLHQNLGIAKAQNVGIDKIKTQRYKAVVFLDQDSEVNSDIINGLLCAFNELTGVDNKTIAVGPLIIDKETGNQYKTADNVCNDYQKVSSLISSGTLARLDYLEEVGGMDEVLFIDNVDHEWCWRAINKGYSIYRANKVKFPHKVGKKTIRFCGMQFLESAPIRCYYKARNTILLAKRDYVPKKWKIKSMIKQILMLIMLPFIADEPWSSSKYLVKGICHGIMNK